MGRHYRRWGLLTKALVLLALLVGLRVDRAWMVIRAYHGAQFAQVVLDALYLVITGLVIILLAFALK